MKDHNKNQTVSPARIASIIILCCTLVLLFIINQVRKSHLISIQKDEALLFNQAKLLINEKVNSYIYGLQGMNGVYQIAGYNPTTKEVREYASSRDYFKNFPGTLGFGFIRKVTFKELPSYLQNRKKMGQNLSIKNLSEVGDKDHYIIETIEPIENNLMALGLNIASEAKRYNAATEAKRTGKARMTAPITLVQTRVSENSTNAVGFLLLNPLYNKPYIPNNENERIERLVGWAYTPIYAEAIREFLVTTIDPK